MSLPVISQTNNYIYYYQQCVNAEVNVCRTNIDSAFHYYQQAFLSVDYPLTKDVYNATICSALLRKDSLMFEGIQICLSRGFRLVNFRKNMLVFGTYFSDNRWRQLEMREDSLINDCHLKLDTNYYSTLKLLDNREQETRHKIKEWNFWFPKSKNTKKKFAQVAEIDSLNRLIIDSLILLYGYPCEQNIGLARSSDFLMCWNPVSIYHYRDSVFIFKTLFNAMRQGQLSPRYYATKVDDLNFVHRKEPVYYTLFNPISILDEETIIINLRRNAIGLPTLEEEEIMRNYYRTTHNQYSIYLYIPFFK
jgi:hypothetical protein